MKTAILYGSSTGTTAAVARKIASLMNVPPTDVYDVAATAPSKLAEYDRLVMGSPTYGAGELQDDWYDFLDGAEVLDLRGKTIALFGCGDETMSDTFCGAVGEMYDRLVKTGADFVGEYTSAPYDFSESSAVKSDDGMAVGLLIDEVNHPDLTEGRIAEWVRLITA